MSTRTAGTRTGDRTESGTVGSETPVLQLPVTGSWKLIKSPGHDRFAFDLSRVDPVSHRTMAASRLKHVLAGVATRESYSWSAPVRAPIGGTVVSACKVWPDRERLHLLKDVWSMFFSRPELRPDDIRPFAGNHVIIEGDDVYVFLAHLREGSVQVREGDDVEVGQHLGNIGNSGFTLEPHLHFQLFDQIDDLLAAEAPPFVVDRYERWNGESWELVRNAPLTKGDLIRTVDGAS